jgi:RNA polymerase sigma factor for flagellar operon FliA
MTATDSFQQRIEQNQGLVRSLAWKIHQRLPDHVEFDDLVGYGQVGLAEAARDFDPERGSAFSTFAYYRIRGAIYDGLAKLSWHSRAHYRNVRFQQMADEVLRLESEQQSIAESHAEDHEKWFKRMTGTLAVVYFAAGTRSDDDDMQIVDPSAAAPLNDAMGREVSAKLRELIDALPSEAGSLVRAVYYDGLTLKEAGERIGISKAWASRLHARTLDQLARALRQIGVAD